MRIKVGDIVRPKHERTIFGVVTKEIDQYGMIHIIWFNSPQPIPMKYQEHLTIKVS